MLARDLKVITALVASLLPMPVPAQKSCAQPTLVTDSKFVPGEVWQYKTRAGEETSTLTILRVEKTPKLGTIVHVRIDGVHFSNCRGGPSPNVLQHLPFSKTALEASVTVKVGSAHNVPDYAAGYQDWLTHCGGVYTLTVDRVIAIDDDTFSAGLGCH